jgi:hypothetical protein
MSPVNHPTDPLPPPLRRFWKRAVSGKEGVWLTLSLLLPVGTVLWLLQRLRLVGLL